MQISIGTEIGQGGCGPFFSYSKLNEIRASGLTEVLGGSSLFVELTDSDESLLEGRLFGSFKNMA